MKTLKDAKVGQSYIVKKVHGEGPTRRRLMDMGITKNTNILIRKLAPLGDPMELALRGYELSIRLSEAALIEVE